MENIRCMSMTNVPCINLRHSCQDDVGLTLYIDTQYKGKIQDFNVDIKSKTILLSVSETSKLGDAIT